MNEPQPMRLAVAVLVAVGPGWAAGTIHYGSRTGIVVDVVPVSGLGTANAVIEGVHLA